MNRDSRAISGALGEDTGAEFAAVALQKLEQMHSEFIKHVAALTTKKVNAGELDTDGNNLLVTCLGVRMQASPRPIARDGQLSALEYPFLAMHREREVLVWRMFLETDYSLYADVNQQQRICTFNNQYLVTYVIRPLASALLRSSLFAPLSDS